MNHKSINKQSLVWAGCIALFLVILGWWIRKQGGGFNWTLLILLLCPLAHIWMMRQGGGCHGHKHEDNKNHDEHKKDGN